MESTLPPYRRKGNTTRLVDNFIQKLFTEGFVQVYDHHGTREADHHCWRIFVKRLSSEHYLTKGFILDSKELVAYLNEDVKNYVKIKGLLKKR